MMLTKVCISLQVARVTTRRAVSTVQTSDLTELAKKLDIKSHEDWYAKLKRCQLSEIGTLQVLQLCAIFCAPDCPRSPQPV
jgi:hypothetical protein